MSKSKDKPVCGRFKAIIKLFVYLVGLISISMSMFFLLLYTLCSLCLAGDLGKDLFFFLGAITTKLPQDNKNYQDYKDYWYIDNKKTTKR